MPIEIQHQVPNLQNARWNGAGASGGSAQHCTHPSHYLTRVEGLGEVVVGSLVESPDAVDWLLSGAALAALGALVLTSRVERRLSASLRELVDLARNDVARISRPGTRRVARLLEEREW